MRMSVLRRYYSAIPKRGTLLWQAPTDNEFTKQTFYFGGTIHKWHVKEGDKVKRHDLLLSLELDKAIYDVRARLEGTVVTQLAEEGQDIQMDERVVIIAHEEEEV